MAVISFPRQRDLAQNLAQSMKIAGVRDERLYKSFMQACFTLFTAVPDESWPPPPEFYDLQRSARIHARREQMDERTALRDLLKSPATLFEIVGLIDTSGHFNRAATVQDAEDDAEPPARRNMCKADGSVDKRLGRTLNLEDIYDSALLTLQITGKRPVKGGGKVLYGALAGDVWLNIDMAIRNGQRGLKDCGFTSLSDYLNSRQMPRKADPVPALKAA